MTKNKTISSLREIFIIQTLLNCKKKRTIELIENTNKLMDTYYKKTPDSKPKKELTNKTINPILRSLKNEGIIKREQIPEDEYEGRGIGGHRYWLHYDIGSFLMSYIKIGNLLIIGNKTQDEKKHDFFTVGKNFINSPFCNTFLNLDLINRFEQTVNENIPEDLKLYLIKVCKFSPTALLSMILRFNNIYEMETNKNNVKNDDTESLISLGAVELIIGEVTNAFLNDILSPYFSSSKNFEVTHEILLKELEMPQVNVVTIKSKNKDQILGNSLTWDSRNMNNPNKELVGYNELVDANVTLQKLLNIFGSILDEIITETPEIQKLFKTKIIKRKPEIKRAFSTFKDPSLKFNIENNYFKNLYD